MVTAAAEKAGNGVGVGGAVRKPTTAEKYRELLDGDPKLALELALAENDRAKTRISESKTIALTEDGRMIATTLEGLQLIGNFFANTQLVPDRFRGKTNDCAVGVHMAMRMKVDPLLMLQSLYVVHGTPGLEGKLVIALLNASPKIKGRVRYELSGDFENRKCIASAVDAETGDVHSAECNMDMARAEGWLKNSKWTSLRDLMLMYRSASFLGRTSFPDITMGLHTVDELHDMTGGYIDGEVVGEARESGRGMVIETEDDPLAEAVARGANKAAAARGVASSDSAKSEVVVADEQSEQGETEQADADDAEFQAAADAAIAAEAQAVLDEQKAKALASGGVADSAAVEEPAIDRWIRKLEGVRAAKGADDVLRQAFLETDQWTDAELKFLTETCVAVKKRLGKTQ